MSWRGAAVPLNGSALSPVHATVADAVRLGADAVGYMLYVGTPAGEAEEILAKYPHERALASR